MRSRLAVVCLALVVCSAARQNAAPCDTAETCRQRAVDAASRGEFETFHDLAWLAMRKGRPNDPELMYLLARAQSLSGRPHDALVMLRRLAPMGVPAEAETHEDFRRVRALPGWPEVAASIAAAREVPSPVRAAPPVEPRPVEPPPAPAAAAPTPPVPSPPAAPEPLTIARRSFAPVGLAYDAVSRRFIAGDRRANKLIVLDEEFRRVNDLAAAASAGFFGLTAVEIDRPRGDLWVANAKGDGSHTALHRLQLVSGRVLEVLPLPAAHGAATFGDIALTPGGTVLALDTLGRRVFRLRSGRYLPGLTIDADALLSIAAFDEQTGYVATSDRLLRVDFTRSRIVPVRVARGTSLSGFVHIRPHRGSIIGVQRGGDKARIVRIRLDRAGVKAASTELIAEVSIADPTSLSVDGGMLHYLGRDADGATTVRHLNLQPAR